MPGATEDKGYASIKGIVDKLMPAGNRAQTGQERAKPKRKKGKKRGTTRSDAAAQSGVTAPVQKSLKIDLTVPEGASEGSKLKLTGPDGNEMSITVPKGLKSGDKVISAYVANSLSRFISLAD
jgi:hypothetical protein